MKRTLRAAMAIILVGLLGAPLSAQQASLPLPLPERAAKGEQVVVTLRDGEEIRGKVGGWVDKAGFKVRPANGPAVLIHPDDVVSIRDAATDRALDLPSLPLMTRANKILLGVALGIGVPVLVMGLVCASYRNGGA